MTPFWGVLHSKGRRKRAPRKEIMSNANRNLTGSAVHALDRMGVDLTRWAVCGAEARHTAGEHMPGVAVTCKRCLASLAKRDRAFQRKARRGLSVAGYRESLWMYDSAARELNLQRGRSIYAGRRYAEDAARAIAREEGRAL